MISRRHFLVSAAVMGFVISHWWRAPVVAGESSKVLRVGFLGLPRADQWKSKIDALMDGLRDHGYVQGKNLVIEFRWAEGQYDLLPALGAQLIAWKPDILISHATAGVAALKAATRSIPIVIAATGDAVAAGLVASLSKPGGNITGSSFFFPELTVKRLELVHEAFPSRRRIALLYNDRLGNLSRSREQASRVAGELKLTLIDAPVSNPADIGKAFESIEKQRAAVVVVLEDPMIVGNATAIAAAARRMKLPLVGFLEIAEAGGLFSYGADLSAMHRRAAGFVDRIVKGAQPGDLPIEQASQFEMVVNATAARELGIKLPPAVMARANRVIE